MPEFIAIVQCPKCHYKQKTTTIKRVKCLNEKCQRTYTVIPIMLKRNKKFKSRIIQVIKGDSHKEYWKEKKRRQRKKL